MKVNDVVVNTSKRSKKRGKIGYVVYSGHNFTQVRYFEDRSLVTYYPGEFRVLLPSMNRGQKIRVQDKTLVIDGSIPGSYYCMVGNYRQYVDVKTVFRYNAGVSYL